MSTSIDEARDTALHEELMKTDLEYAMNYYGIDKAYDAVMEVVNKSQMTYKEVLKYMEDI